MDRARFLSVAFGIGAATVLACVGPVYGGLVVILATPVFFLTISRVLLGVTTDPVWAWLLATSGIAWLVLLPVAPIVHGSGFEPTADQLAVWIGLGTVPLFAGLGLMVRARHRATSAA